jgi:hypothetical protein
MKASFGLCCGSGFIAAALALAACFNPVLEGTLCGPGDSCASGLSCIAEAVKTCRVVCDPSTPFEPGMPLSELNTGQPGQPGHEDDPSWTSDRLTIVFMSTRNGGQQLFKGTRTSTASPFNVQPIEELNAFMADQDKASPEINSDGTTIYFTAGMKGSRHKVYMSLLTGGRWDNPTPVQGLSNDDDEDVAVSPDGLTAMIAGNGMLMIASRTPTDPTLPTLPKFMNLMPVPFPSGSVPTTDDPAAPSLTNNADTVYFHSGMARDLYYASRNSNVFKAPMPVVGLNTEGRDSAPFVSADGCSLLFARDYNIYQATRR